MCRPAPAAREDLRLRGVAAPEWGKAATVAPPRLPDGGHAGVDAAGSPGRS
jgi:hypothetical protein